MIETLNQIITDACIQREQSEQDERMKDYVAAGLTLEQALSAEKAYSNRRKRHPNGFIGRLTTVASPDGKYLSCELYVECRKSGSEGKDEKKAETSVKEKFEDLRIIS
ncbi:hypothetical protein C5167_026452 [Papaver somniferum]|nr:hypothetical protein C5167_026452 [Papaver somniferum]